MDFLFTLFLFFLDLFWNCPTWLGWITMTGTYAYTHNLIFIINTNWTRCPPSVLHQNIPSRYRNILSRLHYEFVWWLYLAWGIYVGLELFVSLLHHVEVEGAPLYGKVRWKKDDAPSSRSKLTVFGSLELSVESKMVTASISSRPAHSLFKRSKAL